MRHRSVTVYFTGSSPRVTYEYVNEHWGDYGVSLDIKDGTTVWVPFRNVTFMEFTKWVEEQEEKKP